MALKNLSDTQLIFKTKKLTQGERGIHVQVLKHLSEINRRKLFLKYGFQSLYEYAKLELGCSESAAYRRIHSMRLLDEVPEVEEKIQSGAINLSTATRLQRFFSHQAQKQPSLSLSEKPRTRFLSKESKLKLIEEMENKSGQQVDKVLWEINPETKAYQEHKVKPLCGGRTKIELILTKEEQKVLEKAQSLLSHSVPSFSAKDLVLYLCKKEIKRKLGSTQGRKPSQPKLKKQGTDTPRTNKPSSAKVRWTTRYIPKKTRRLVWCRDQGCCSYVDPKHQRKCGSRYQVQIDHIRPFSIDGGHEPSNLRLLCGVHNRARNAGLV